MNETIDRSKIQLRQLHQRVNNAEIFQSLITEVGTLIEQVPNQRRTKVASNFDSQKFIQVDVPYYEKAIKQRQHLNQAAQENLFTAVTSANPGIRELAQRLISNNLARVLIDNDELTKWTNYFMADEQLFSHVLEPKNQAVFARSGCVHVLKLFLLSDRLGYFYLTHEQLQALIDQIALLMVLEKDTRGFVGNYGWAHMFYEIPELLSELAERDDLLRSDHIFLMTVLIERYRRLKTPLMMGEQNGVAGYLVKLLKRHHLYQDYFLMLLRAWRQALSENDKVTKEGDWHLFFNYQRLMNTLLLIEELPVKVAKEIYEKEL